MQTKLPWYANGVMKTHHCGEINSTHVGQEVLIAGWVNKSRDLGGLYFIDLRDKYGLVQLSFDQFQEDLSLLKECSLESVIQCKGRVIERPQAAKNADMGTGDVEIAVTHLQLLSVAERTPFLPSQHQQTTEDLRLKYRYLEMRQKRLQDIIALRSSTARKIREVLYSESFVEVETPILYKTTPEGARDYIVPSRVHPGKVYALPQSPQTLKQLLMIGSTDRYFQICKCFRDEDLRADRQPEFTQVDIEVSYGSVEYLKSLAEKIIKKVFSVSADFILPIMTYQVAMRDYGSDKPDLRFALKHHNVTTLFGSSGFTTFDQVALGSGLIKALFLPETSGVLSRKQIDELVTIVKPYGGKGVAWFKVDGQEITGGISKFITAPILAALKAIDDQKGVWFFVSDLNEKVVHDSADALRRFLGKELKLYGDSDYAFVWIVDFPLLEYDATLKRFFAVHHPFTMPKLDELDHYFSNDVTKVQSVNSQTYDLVCNGYEIAGGSQRIFNAKVQARMFELLGMSKEEVDLKFGFFVEALKYGTPPHGGMAFGFDRLMMLVAKTDNIRDVIAFPKTASASDLMAQAPSIPSIEQLTELNMKFLAKE
jgi:aspartyl-tRNA synthetase